MLPLIRTILIDDEPDSNRVLQTLLENYCPQVKVIGTADEVDTGFSLIESTQPDLVFMDIEMNQGNAFDLLNRLVTIPFHLIFVTAFDVHAVRAFRYNAVDSCLRKPVNITELRHAIGKLSDKYQENNMLDRVKAVLETMRNTNSGEKKIALPTANGLSFVHLRDIVRLEAQGSNTVVHMQDRQRRSNGGNQRLQDLLPENLFYRIHHSHIINLNKIKSYQKGRGGYVTMDDESFIEVASRRRDGFMQRLLK